MEYFVKKAGSRIFLLTVLALGAAYPASLSAATYYVNPSTGSNSNLGTSTAPWKTVAWASTHAANGSTVYLRSGNYGDVTFSQQPTRTSWSQAVSFEAASGATPVFTVLKFSQLPNCYIQVKGVTINPVDKGTSTYSAAINIYDSSHIKVINCSVNGVWKNSVEAGMTDYGVQIRYGSRSMSDILIDGCELKDLQRGIDLSGVIRDGVIFRNNHIYHTAGGGILLSSSNTDNGLVVIENNHIHNQSSVSEGTGTTHGTGIAIRMNNLLIKGNIIHDCGNTRGLRTYDDVPPAGGYRNITLENNLIYDTINDLPVDFTYLSDNIVLRNNTIIGHYSGSSQPKLKHGSSITFNVAPGKNGSGVSFYNNVFVGYVSLNPGFTNYTENNNIIWAAVDQTEGGVWKSSLKGSKTKILCYDGYTYDLSLFGKSGRFFVGGSEFETYSYTVTENNGSNTPHGVDLTDSYRLASGSLAIGFGDPANGTTTDLRGVIRGSVVDAGCYEYAASSTTSNRAPTFPAIGNKTARVGSQLSFVLSATDPDGDTVTYSATNMPSGATLTGDTFSWTPTASQQTTSRTVTFTASDGRLSTSQQVTITVSTANQAPIVGPVAPQTATVDELCSFSVPVSDPDGDSLLCAATNLPSGATFQNSIFRWTPVSSQIGTRSVEFYANDGSITTTYNVAITVQAAPTSGSSAIIIDNATSNTSSTGNWQTSTAANPYGGRSVWSYDGAVYNWHFKPAVTGTYRVSMWWTALSTRSDNVPIMIRHRNGSTTKTVNQQKNGGIWNNLGEYMFIAGITYKITLTAPSGSPPSTCADAVKFEKI